MNYRTDRPEMRPPLDRQNFPAVHTINPSSPGSPSSGVGVWIPVRKTASESRPSTTLLINDGVLYATLAPSTKYAVRASIIFDTTLAGDFKWALIGPAAPTLIRIARRWIVGNGAAYAGVAVDTGYTPAQGLDGTLGAGLVEFYATIHNGVNAGVFAFQWAQNTNDAGATTVLAGSVLEYMVI